ncbi:MAG: alanine racemase [Bacteroidales bacterium]|nr:alanine racemase [Bacteroidales bacterium]
MEKKRYERPFIKRLDINMPGKSGQQRMQALTQIEGIPVKSLIQEYNSPLFVISERQIRDHYRKAKLAFDTRYPQVQFAWSYKTNYLDAVCKVYHQEGSWAEVVSGFEYQKAIRNGVPGDKIIFNGPDKNDQDLRLAIENDSLIHIDHLDELYSLTRIATESNQKPKVAIRVNMDTGVYPMWDRFGFNYENGQAWDAINKIMHGQKLELVGLHCHIGTFMLAANAYKVAATKMADLAISLQKKFDHHIKYIDMGGGFASPNTLKGSFLPGYDVNPTFDDYAEAISGALLNSNFKTGHLPLLILETGRALIDESAYLIGSVIANKRLASGKRTTIGDVGVNILFTSFWYNHKVLPAQEFSQYTEDTVMYGPLCMNIDVIRENINLPLLNKGDHFVVHNVGAYNMTQWMQFITLRPKVVMIDNQGQTHIIRNNENMDSLTSHEQTPEHLTKFEL